MRRGVCGLRVMRTAHRAPGAATTRTGGHWRPLREFRCVVKMSELLCFKIWISCGGDSVSAAQFSHTLPDGRTGLQPGL